MAEWSREEYVAALRKAADFIEKSVDVPIPFRVSLGWIGHGEEGKDGVLALVNAIDGTVTKDYQTSTLWAWAWEGGPVTFHYGCDRDLVCERIVTGTVTVPAEPERVLAAIPEHEEEIVEWRCKPLLAKDEVSA